MKLLLLTYLDTIRPEHHKHLVHDSPAGRLHTIRGKHSMHIVRRHAVDISPLLLWVKIPRELVEGERERRARGGVTEKT
jgi:hypothetical protein